MGAEDDGLVGGARPIPVVLCIDVEPDPRLVSRQAPEPWRGYEATQRSMEEWRARFGDATGAPVHFAWFLRMDPQIAGPYGSASWVADRYGAHLDAVQRQGDEVGVHPHPYRWSETANTWVHEFADQGWVDHCLEMSLQTFERALGRPCRSMRFGDRWLNTATVNLAERLGIRHDLTLEPGAPSLPSPMEGEHATGPLPDYYRVPRVPYIPSPREFRRASRNRSRTIRMMPLTSACLHLGLQPRRYLARLLRNGVRHRRQDTPLSMWRLWRAPDTFDRMLDRALAAQGRPYLAFAIRADGRERPELADRVDACLRALLVHRARERFVFSTPAAALAMLDGNEAAGES